MNSIYEVVNAVAIFKMLDFSGYAIAAVCLLCIINLGMMLFVLIHKRIKFAVVSLNSSVCHCLILYTHEIFSHSLIILLQL